MNKVNTIKVIIVNHSAVVRINLKKLLEKDKKIEVIRAVSKPETALQWMAENSPHVVITDIEFPLLDGISFIKKAQKMTNCSYIVFSAVDPAAINSLNNKKELSVFHIITKPKINLKQFLKDNQNLFISSVISAAKCINKNTQTNDGEINLKISKNDFSNLKTKEIEPKLNADAVLPPWNGIPVKYKTEKIVVIGASAGGIQTIEKILVELPEQAPGIVIVQHLSDAHTYQLANRYNAICRIKAKEIEEGDPVRAGMALITPGGEHSILKRVGKGYIVKLSDGPRVKRHKPSVDVLFRSAAMEGGKNILGIILTGMGDDGAEEMLTMHRAGSPTIAQNEKTCIVYGMPREAIKWGGVDKVLPLKEIPGAIMKFYNGDLK